MVLGPFGDLCGREENALGQGSSVLEIEMFVVALGWIFDKTNRQDKINHVHLQHLSPRVGGVDRKLPARSAVPDDAIDNSRICSRCPMRKPWKKANGSADGRQQYGRSRWCDPSYR
jgi:hypothetical protein